MENKLPTRKPLRLKNFDYNSNGSYFITICTHNKAKTLSKIVADDDDMPVSKLNKWGEFTDAAINSIPAHLGVEVDCYVIMPNHIHLIIVLTKEETCESEKRSTVSKAIGYIKMQASKRIHSEFGNVKVWQRNYNDHVIRNKNDFEKTKDYVYYNPLRWTDDCFNR